MSKTKKVWLITAVSLVVIGLILFVISMAVLDLNFANLSTVNYETKTYEVSGDFNKISIDVDTPTILFVPSDDENCRVVCDEQEKVKYSVAVRNGTLVIDTVDHRKWYDYIGIFLGDTKITVYLPDDEYTSLLIDTDTGNIDIPKEFAFETIHLSTDTGDIACYACASDAIQMESDTGDIKMDNLTTAKIDLSTDTGNISVNSVTSNGIVEVETNTGKIMLTALTCTKLVVESDTGTVILKNVIASDTISVESATGDVRFDGSDAAEIRVKTSTGDVTGTLLSEKIFVTKTSTGDINVPNSVNGGKCEIFTSTGDIEIEIP